MRVIVTGATGFIGREIVSELAEGGNTVFQVGRTPRYAADGSLTAANGNFFKVDIVNYAGFDELRNLDNIDAVIHSAGLAHQFGDTSKKQFDAVNVTGTENVLKLATELNVRQFILISSTAVYGIKPSAQSGGSGREPVIIDEETECQPETLYAESKLAAEKLAIASCQSHGLPLTILRLAPVIGEGSTGNAARLVEAVGRGRFVWIGTGQNLKSLIYKKDVAGAVRRILENKNMEQTVQPEIFNLAAPPLTMSDLVGEIKKCLRRDVPKFYIPPGLLRSVFAVNDRTIKSKEISKVSVTVEKWLSDDIYSGRKIKRVYDFEPPTTIAEAIEKQVAGYLKKKVK